MELTQSCCLLLLPAQGCLLCARDPFQKLPFLKTNSFAVFCHQQAQFHMQPLSSTCSLLNQSLTWVHQIDCVLAAMRLEIGLFWILPWGGQAHTSGEFLDLTWVLLNSPEINAYHRRPEVHSSCRASSLQCSGGPLWGSQVNGKMNPSPTARDPYKQLDHSPKAPRYPVRVFPSWEAAWGHPCSLLSRSTSSSTPKGNYQAMSYDLTWQISWAASKMEPTLEGWKLGSLCVRLCWPLTKMTSLVLRKIFLLVWPW